MTTKPEALGPVCLHTGTGRHQSSRALSRLHPDIQEQMCSPGGEGQGTTSERVMCPEDVVLEKTLESPLDCKEIQPLHSDQPWVFIGRTDAKAETPVLWPPHAKS